MNATVLRRFLIAGAVGAGFLAVPRESQAIFHWFKSCCQPAVPCAAPVQVAQYVPQVAYRTQYVNVPVTTYRPITSCGPCGGQQVSYMPVTSYQTQAQMVPYTTYRIVYSNITPAPVVATPVVANYAPAVAVAPAAPVAQASCCTGAATASTYYRAPGVSTAYYAGTPTGYSAYSAPVYNGAGFGPPSAGLPVDNSSSNLMQSATTGSSLRGVSPTLSPGSPFANGSSSGAQYIPQQPMQGQMLQAPAAAQYQGQPLQPYSQPTQQHVPNQQYVPNQPTPAAPQTSTPSSSTPPSTYDYNSNSNGASGAARPVTPSHTPPATAPVPAPQQQPIQESPIKPIPHEEPGPAVDPTSGPSIIPPASRTTQAPANRSFAYTRLSYLPGETTARKVEVTSLAPVAQPAANDGGWRAAGR